nr:Virulence factor mviM homolog [Klebsiella pneumoniae]
MGTRLRIGVVGLGSIAQKAWLPVLGAAESWTLQAAGRRVKRRRCGSAKRRMPYADSLDARRHSAMRSLSIPRRLHIMK